MHKKSNLFTSFRHAVNGIYLAVRHERNMLLHFLIALAVLCVSFFLKISTLEFIIILLVIGLVITAEMLNTAIEKTVDLISQDWCIKIKFIKDVSAAGVLMAALTAFLVGMVIFIPKILVLF